MNNLNDCFASVSGRLTMAEAVGRFVNGILPVVGKENIPLAKAPVVFFPQILPLELLYRRAIILLWMGTWCILMT